MGWNDSEEMDKPAKRKLAGDIIGGGSTTTENSDPDNSDETPDAKIAEISIKRAKNGFVATHHYVPPDPASSPEEAMKPEHKHQPPMPHVFKSPEELHDHVGKMLKHMLPTEHH